MADGLLDAMADRGADGSAVEFMHDFAYLLPVTVICELIGIPEADREGFRPLARDLAGVFELHDPAALPAINAAAVELLAYFTALADRRRAEPRDDLLSDLLAVSDADDGRLTDAELLHNLTLLLVAGFETTTNLLGNGLHVILADPPAGRAVRDGSVVTGRVRRGGAALRLAGPAHQPDRLRHQAWASVAVSPATEIVVTLLGAGTGIRAGSPTRPVRPARPDGGPLSFGGGAHFCIGAALARLEATVAFPRLLSRFPQIEAAGEPVRRDTLSCAASTPCR